MGTRARVAVKNEDGRYTSIYTHWDGYPSHHGPILLNGYVTEDKVRKLMALGDLSSLGESIGEKHPFDGPHDGVCNAYGRDRGEDGVGAKHSANLPELLALTKDCGGEWLYVFDGGRWLAAGGAYSAFGMPANKEVGPLRPLQEVMAEAAED